MLILCYVEKIASFFLISKVVTLVITAHTPGLLAAVCEFCIPSIPLEETMNILT